MEDQRIGAALRRLRIDQRLRQVDLSSQAGVPRTVVMAVEAGRLENVSFGHIRRIAQALGGRFEGQFLWRGAELDRMLNRGHARMHEGLMRWLGELADWIALPEVSFSFSGERGVIDIVAWHAASRSLLVIELKTQIADISALMATMDIRRRVASRIARDHGWNPASVSIWVVVAPSRTNERLLAEYQTVLRAKFPADGRSMRRWLARPDGSVAGLSFLPQVRVGDLRRELTTPRRVRPRKSRPFERQPSRHDLNEPRIGVTFRD
jgi:transcriptional regulator with XRE-family HTH domain